MPTITFDESATETILEPFDITVDDDNYLIHNDERLTDTRGNPVSVDEVAGIIDLPAYDMTISNDGVVLDVDGNPVSDSHRQQDAIIPFLDPNNRPSGVLRDCFSAQVDFIEATRHT